MSYFYCHLRTNVQRVQMQSSQIENIISQYTNPKIFCFFKNSSFKYFMVTALHNVDKYYNEQQVLGPKSSRKRPPLTRGSYQQEILK